MGEHSVRGKAERLMVYRLSDLPDLNLPRA